MTGIEMIWEILTGLAAVVAAVGLITAIVTKLSIKNISGTRNIYLGKMSNSDLSIQEAIKYLKLTNGISMDANGENGNE